MAGHSKWSTIKRKKAATDAKRGKLFTKLLKEVQIAAKMGGGSPDGNPRLKTAIQTAKSNSVPNDNIDRAIKRGEGDLEGADYEEIMYEGYGPAGVAVLVKTLTDNKNRTVSEVRHCFSKNGGSLGSSNSVSYLFEERGIFTIESDSVSEEELFELAIEAGASDLKNEAGVWIIDSDASEFANVRDALEKLDCKIEAELQMVPSTLIKLEGKDAHSVLRLMDAIDDLDDVQAVFSNFDVDEKDLE